MKIIFVFGGSGYISYFLINKLIELNLFDKFIIYDITPPKYFNILPSNVEYISCDVRNEIQLYKESIDVEKSWIFNLAAIHREPGHDQKEYFDTNIKGVKNINDFAEKLKIKNIFFFSSIAPYGKSLIERTEKSELYPETPYGISKVMAELLHKNWLSKDSSRRLIIVRPSVIYGPKDPGNVYRTIKALKNGFFVLPNGGKVIKSYGYVYGLVDSIIFTMNKTDRDITYNYSENPLLNLKEMTVTIKKNLNYNKPTLSMPVSILSFVAGVFQIGFKLIGKKSDIHPTRVRKASFPTNIRPHYLIENGFVFNYGFEKSLEHWKSIEPNDFQ